jgi:hypothetical protein
VRRAGTASRSTRLTAKSLTLAVMLFRRASIVLAVCGACSFDHGVPMNNGNGGDSGVDGPDSSMPDPDAPDANPNCFGTFVNVCLQALPTTDVVVDTDRDVNTDTGCPVVAPQPMGQTLCVVVGRNVTINARLRGNGPRPLVVLATNTLMISGGGLVDVGSFKIIDGFGNPTGEVIGAAAATGATLCGTQTAGAVDNGQGAGGGGGAGGSFVGKGGAGAAGANNLGGAGGTSANAIAAPSFMRGGCRGSNGGSGAGNTAGAGGSGGGAVLLIAGVSISNAGHIRAGGMGGYAGGTSSGGGGGGSGGMIVLDAPSIANAGIINANAGGGGEGGGNSTGEGGFSALTGTAAAAGGANNPNGGDGGAGSWQTTVTGAPGVTGLMGGGGGGGGAGVIRVYPSLTLAGTVSPNPS